MFLKRNFEVGGKYEVFTVIRGNVGFEFVSSRARLRDRAATTIQSWVARAELRKSRAKTVTDLLAQNMVFGEQR